MNRIRDYIRKDYGIFTGLKVEEAVKILYVIRCRGEVAIDELRSMDGIDPFRVDSIIWEFIRHGDVSVIRESLFGSPLEVKSENNHSCE